MSSNKITVICHWGGNIATNNQGGLDYVGGEQGCMRVKQDISFRQLVSKIYVLTRIDKGTYKIKMTCRFPEYFDAHCSFTPLPIVDNASVEAMLYAVVESTRLACVHLYVEIEHVANVVLGDVSQINSIHVPSPPTHEDDHSRTLNQFSQFRQTERYENYPIDEDSHLLTQHHPLQFSQSETEYPAETELFPSLTQNQSTLLSPPVFQAQSPHRMFPDLNAPASTSGTELRDCTRLENVLRLVQADDDNLDNNDMSAGSDSEISLDRDLSDDGEHSDSGVAPMENNFDDGLDRGQASSSMVRMYEPISDFFTHIDDPVQQCDRIGSDVVVCSEFDPKRDELRKGLLFKDKETLKDAVTKYSIHKQRHFMVSRNSNPTCWEVFCKYRETCNCLWRLRASLKRRHGLVEIVTYPFKEHSCSFTTINTDHPGLNSSLISREIYDLVKKDPSFKVGSIVETLRGKYTFSTTYQKAWNAKQKAIGMIFGDWDKSYKLLPKFLGAIQKYNEGTVVHYDTIPHLRNPAYTIFQRVFWVFAPCIEGFKSCRPMVSVDATFLYGKYKGKILIAMGRDANNQVFPLAFAIVDEESRSNWGWFLSILRRDVVGNRPGLCLISDRHRGILSAVEDVSNGWDSSIAHHRFCLRHVRSNFNDKFKNAELKTLMYEAGSALEIRHFNYAMEKIKTINERAWEYLVAIPPEKWTLSHDGGYRFGDKTTNISECFNSVLKHGRCLPITACVQVIFFKCVAYFADRRMEGLKYKSLGKIFTPSIQSSHEGMLFRSGGTMTVHTFDRQTGEAGVITDRGSQHAVLIKQHMCTCGWWQTYKMPCSHAVEVMKTVAVNSWDYISPYYTLDTYLQTWGHKFHPLHPEEYWDEPIGPIWIPDSTLAREKGRPRSTRITNEMDIREPRTTNCCGICRQPGHTRRTCESRATQLQQ